ncbi:plasmid stabilization protein [Nitratireductor sp. L1-7-SE]|uniref:Plasmid stabilization protein n=1 Tax=Nitratireductor rhodophyticola TaxID=2854036 RepID=A0ABS7R7J8_9HYPH|nr:plasmid stabilization protein [Nitratireductor rhodophyticola]MBY8916629.1 plasmid stabilization protein [Nitratireductor rhodophyticola]MBY8921993.1 plasmid stabilization protein [Nitratireductor rhodophyticola]
MATLTIRNVDEKVRRALKKRAAENDVSMEEEVRRILARSVQPHTKTATHQNSRRAELIGSISVRPIGAFDLKAITDEIWNGRTL